MFFPFLANGDILVTLSGDALNAHSSLGGYYRHPVHDDPIWYKTDYERYVCFPLLIFRSRMLPSQGR
jgi:hypothetical protein